MVTHIGKLVNKNDAQSCCLPEDGILKMNKALKTKSGTLVDNFRKRCSTHALTCLASIKTQRTVALPQPTNAR